jgi:hypothetical protein
MLVILHEREARAVKNAMEMARVTERGLPCCLGMPGLDEWCVESQEELKDYSSGG